MERITSSSLKALKWFKSSGKFVMLCIPNGLAFSDLFYSVRTVEGVSMQPTLNTEMTGKVLPDFVLLSKWEAAALQFDRGDVVSLVSPKDPDEWLIKRVVALEGDRIKFGYFNETTDIPKGHCWVEGDNKKCSMDSNEFGAVSLNMITSKATHVWHPISHLKKLERKELGDDRLTKAESVERGQMFFGWDL